MEKLLELPPLAIITFGAVLAVIFGVRYLGLWQGQNSGPAASAGAAQVAAVIVDPTALNAAAGEVAGLAMAVTEANVTARAHTAATDRLADKVDELSGRVDRLTDKVVDAAAKIR
ncbi:MAG: hypothetical protein P0Y65_05915 [Candidatus Devosia phytovorans]|uniref:Uncharacterized protein n=1 Tax=Candidatus Devosia phytovorans TaxID=3121372 RepID=A0AAJ5VXC0_9HYPH|nr:hypothetical protein [Devosia sp.]WEK05791.1 MAG: hypothetical protein P0Y65_05915 [Devosia sp.]